MSKIICQSCGMIMESEDLYGTNEDGTKNTDYCHFCFTNGKYNSNDTMEEMIESCIPFRLEDGTYKDADSARTAMLKEFAGFKRWSK